MLNEKLLTREVRKFLSTIDLLSQQEIERAVKEAVRAKQLTGDETLTARMTLEIAEIKLEIELEDTIALS